MEVLVYLARRPGEVVARDTLIRDVWGETFVTDHVLTRCIGELRKVFDDDVREPRVIQTIDKSGYRLIAPVEAADRSRRRPRLPRTSGPRTYWRSRCSRSRLWLSRELLHGT